ncbi:MAG: SAM-dependent methyltransferase, partial [Spirillospora sp.]
MHEAAMHEAAKDEAAKDGGEVTWGDAPATEGVASRLAPLLTRILLPDGRDGQEAEVELPIRVLAWDGSSIGPSGAPAFVVRHRRALRRLLWKPGELGLVRAYVAGELDIEGDVFAALDAVRRVLRDGDAPIRLSADDKRDIVRTAVTLGAVGPEPKPPPEELAPGRRAAGRHGAVRRGTGGRGTGGRGAADEAETEPMREPAAFFTRLLGDGLAHGTGQWDGAVDLQDAQAAAHVGIAERLGLFPGARLLDLNCGWGAFARYAAVQRGARVVALARTSGQADHARALTAGDDVDIRGFDLDEAGDGPYDAIIGLAGVVPIDRPASRLRGLLAPGGRLVLRQPVRRPGPRDVGRTFITGYMVPDGAEPRPLGALVDDLEEAGLEVRGVAALREDHARTLR